MARTRSLGLILRAFGASGAGIAASSLPATRPAFEPLEGRTLMSGSAAPADGAERLRVWWALSGSSQLTVKLANDHAATARSRAGATRGRYSDPSPARTAARATDAEPATMSLTATATSTAAPSSAAAAAPVLPAMPTSDAWLGAVVNANNYITAPYYMSNLSPDMDLMTDLSGTTMQTYTDSVNAVQAAHPNMLIGTYHSSRDAQLAGTFSYLPRRAVPKEGLTDRQILMKTTGPPDVYVVDYTQAAARKYLVKNVVDDVARTGRRLAFLDNVSHHETGFPINWTVTTSVVKEMTATLKAQGRRVIVNAAWVPGLTATQSVDQFMATGVDGVSLEMGFHQNVRNDVGRINTAIQQYRRMLDAGMTVIFIPSGAATGDAPTVENLEIEQRVQAAFGMMFRKGGDRLFVSQAFWRPVPEWADWTKRFGPAVGAAAIARNELGQVVITRAFTNYTLTLNTATKEVTTVATAPAPTPG